MSKLRALVYVLLFGLAAFVVWQFHGGEQIEEPASSSVLHRGLVSDPAAPFGGVKQSGLGREGGKEGMREFQETQYISTAW